MSDLLLITPFLFLLLFLWNIGCADPADKDEAAAVKAHLNSLQAQLELILSRHNRKP